MNLKKGNLVKVLTGKDKNKSDEIKTALRKRVFKEKITKEKKETHIERSGELEI